MKRLILLKLRLKIRTLLHQHLELGRRGFRRRRNKRMLGCDRCSTKALEAMGSMRTVKTFISSLTMGSMDTLIRVKRTTCSKMTGIAFQNRMSKVSTLRVALGETRWLRSLKRSNIVFPFSHHETCTRRLPDEVVHFR